MEGFEQKVNRLAHFSKEAFSQPEEDKNNRELLKQSIEEKSICRKVKAILEILKNVLPEEISELIRKKISEDVDFEKLPFDLKKLSIDENKINEGMVSEIFILQSKDGSVPSYVLKIDYVSGGNVEKLHKTAIKDKNEYEEIRNNYHDVENLIPEEYQLIAESPKSKKPAIITVQKFIEGDIRDIFKLEEKELIELLKSDESLKSSFLKFMEVSLRLWEEKGKIIDLKGESNLVVVGQKGGGNNLVFLDPHNLSLSQRANGKWMRQLEERLLYLKKIYESVKD